MVNISKEFHDKIIYSRRMVRLTELLMPLLKDSNTILDVGCGDGKIDSYLLEKNTDKSIQGIDVLVRPETFINVKEYDGKTIPFDANTFDTVMAIDVLHHTDDPSAVLQEMGRVSSKYVILKDHIKSGFVSYVKLRAMDYVGNAHYHVRLPYNYLKQSEWESIFGECNLSIKKWEKNLHLYKGMLHLLFDGNLHFIAVLEKVNDYYVKSVKD